MYPSSGACDYSVELPHWLYCFWFDVCWSFGVVGHKLCFSLQHGYHSNPTTPKLQHTSNQEQNDQCGNSTAQSQAPDDGYINVRSMLSTKEVKKKIASDIKLVFYSSTIISNLEI